jgi:4-carboxymuconolactone decarboxylase
MSERYMRGIEIAEQLAAEKLEEFTTSRVAELAPDFARMAIEFPLGDIYARDELDFRSREIVAITSLATLGNAGPQLRIHIRAATKVGVTKAEIIEILMQTAVYAGFPAALNALASCHDLLTDERPCHIDRRAPAQPISISAKHFTGEES